MPWMDANGISIRFELAGHGPSVVLLHEMGGTLDSWDGVFPALSARFRTLRYDQRGSGLSRESTPADHHRVAGRGPRSGAAGEHARAALSFRHGRRRHHAGADLHDPASRPHRQLRVLQPVHRCRSEPRGGTRRARRARRARRPARRPYPPRSTGRGPPTSATARLTRPIAGATSPTTRSALRP